ncbi:RNA-directed DNA polymerase, eukaryota, reverse transcriptase zinc-binding domain protein [Tanacetum coccineum]
MSVTLALLDSRQTPEVDSTLVLNRVDLENVAKISPLVFVLVVEEANKVASAIPRRNLWDVQADNNCSPMWRTLLGMRDKFREHFWVEIGNGLSTSVWYDNWHINGPLSKFITKRDVYDARMSDKCIVNEAIENGNWAWPNEWTDKFLVLRNYGVLNLNISGKDVTRWKDKNGKIVDFSVKQVWKDSHADGMRTNWTGMVWYAECIPKHAFVLWMAVQGRLLTQDRIMKWKPNAILLYPLCEECNDSHEHLFFKCKLSEKIWKYLQAKLCRKYSMDWQTVIVEMSRLKKSKNIWCIVRINVLYR